MVCHEAQDGRPKPKKEAQTQDGMPKSMEEGPSSQSMKERSKPIFRHSACADQSTLEAHISHLHRWIQLYFLYTLHVCVKYSGFKFQNHPTVQTSIMPFQVHTAQCCLLSNSFFFFYSQCSTHPHISTHLTTLSLFLSSHTISA